MATLAGKSGLLVLLVLLAGAGAALAASPAKQGPHGRDSREEEALQMRLEMEREDDRAHQAQFGMPLRGDVVDVSSQSSLRPPSPRRIDAARQSSGSGRWGGVALLGLMAVVSLAAMTPALKDLVRGRTTECTAVGARNRACPMEQQKGEAP